ncbi:hypothetical protein Taro_030565, partial [Colocasia esculenta]|nr:hypothetical protein [Colocasia esculenta]
VCNFPVRFVCMLQKGCSCCYVECVASVVARCVHAMVAQLVVDSLAVVFPMWRTVAGKSRCSMCHVASLVERSDNCLWLLSAWCWLVVSSGEVEMHRLVALCSGEVFLELYLGGSSGGSPRTGLRCFYLLQCSL